MPRIEDLMPFVIEPREAIDVEYKTWLDLTVNDQKAIIAKAVMALANHGGGYVVIGFDEEGGNLLSRPRQPNIPEITQDVINAAIRRFVTPEFHCDVHIVPHPQTQVTHPVVVVPGGLAEPAMSRRDSGNTLAQNRVYIRKPGPRSEEPNTREEWRALFRRCIQAGREDLLEAIRSIVTGRAEVERPRVDATEELRRFCEAGGARWRIIIENEAADSPTRFPHGFYELGFSLIGATASNGLVQLGERLEVTRRIRHTGWPPFLSLARGGREPYPHDDFIEAWIGRPMEGDWIDRDPAHSDFWRVSLDGKLYMIRGYAEDALENHRPGEVFDVTLPVWRVGEALLFANRLGGVFEGVEAIAIRCRYTGLQGRRLTSVTGNRDLRDGLISRTNEIVLNAQVSPQQVQNNLAEILHPLLTPLYERFGFFQLPFVLVEQELDRMRRGNF